MWDFLPVNLNEIKQIGDRGASAVWGANALYGVVSRILSRREMQGTARCSALSGFDRDKNDPTRGAGTMFTSAAHAQAISDRVAFKISAGSGYARIVFASGGPDPATVPDVCTQTTTTVRTRGLAAEVRRAWTTRRRTAAS